MEKPIKKKLTEKPKINVLKGTHFSDSPKFNFKMETGDNRLLDIMSRDRQKIANSLKLKKLMF